MQKIDIFVFDKTGTLTQGKPTLVNTIWMQGSKEKYAYSILKSLVSNSEHPVAKALHDLDVENEIKVVNFKNTVGQGLEGTVINGSQEEVWRFGHMNYITGFTGEISTTQQVKIQQAANDPYSISCLSRDDQLIAILFFDDSLRDGNEQMIERIIRKGIEPVILSGDTQKSVSHVALALGIHEYHSGMSPQQKMQWVIQQQGKGKIVAMAGDGINDAPTLATADVSFSLADSTGLANNHSDFLLLNGKLESIADSIHLAKKTLTVIKQNIGWAIIYNVIAIPFAIAGWVPPWLAAIGMSVSSIIVVLNSMRLAKVN